MLFDNLLNITSSDGGLIVAWIALSLSALSLGWQIIDSIPEKMTRFKCKLTSNRTLRLYGPGHQEQGDTFWAVEIINLSMFDIYVDGVFLEAPGLEYKSLIEPGKDSSYSKVVVPGKGKKELQYRYTDETLRELGKPEKIRFVVYLATGQSKKTNKVKTGR